MAIQSNWIDKAGIEHNDCYFVVSDVILKKKIVDTPDPVLAVAPDGEPAPGWLTVKGYYGEIIVHGWLSEADRNLGKDPRFVLTYQPTYGTIDTYHEVTELRELKTEFDATVSPFEQAYNYILTLPAFSNATQV